MLRNIILFLLISFTISACASNPKIEVVRPDGGPSPDPMYVLQTTAGDYPMRLSYYFTATRRVEDLDGRKVPSVEYLDGRKEHFFSKDDRPDLHAVLRVLNPRNGKYKVCYRSSIFFSDGGQMDAYAELAKSDMKYREIPCPMPTLDKIKKVTYEVEITDFEGNMIFRTGKIRYYIS